MEEENNLVFIGHVPYSNTVQNGAQISTDYGLFIKLPVLNIIVNRTELNNETDVNIYEEPTTKIIF